MTDSTPDPDHGEIYAPGVGQIYPEQVTPRLSVVIREDAWRALCARYGYHSDVALSRDLGVSSTTVWRIRTRSARPGINFVLQAMRIFESSFDALFEVCEDAPEESAAAA